MMSAPIGAVSAVDAAAWLARYVELGGGYTVSPNGVILHWSLRITEDERRALVMREAVKSYLSSRTMTEAEPC